MHCEFHETTYHQALNDRNREFWITATDNEMDSLHRNHPTDRLVIDCKRVYKVKLKADRSIERFKGQALVEKGYSSAFLMAPSRKKSSWNCLMATGKPVKSPAYENTYMDLNSRHLNGMLAPANASRKTDLSLPSLTTASLFTLSSTSSSRYIHVDDPILIFGSHTHFLTTAFLSNTTLRLPHHAFKPPPPCL